MRGEWVGTGSSGAAPTCVTDASRRGARASVRPPRGRAAPSRVPMIGRRSASAETVGARLRSSQGPGSWCVCIRPIPTHPGPNAHEVGPAPVQGLHEDVLAPRRPSRDRAPSRAAVARESPAPPGPPPPAGVPRGPGSGARRRGRPRLGGPAPSRETAGRSSAPGDRRSSTTAGERRGRPAASRGPWRPTARAPGGTRASAGGAGLIHRPPDTSTIDDLGGGK